MLYKSLAECIRESTNNVHKSHTSINNYQLVFYYLNKGVVDKIYKKREK